MNPAPLTNMLDTTIQALVQHYGFLQRLQALLECGDDRAALNLARQLCGLPQKVMTPPTPSLQPAERPTAQRKVALNDREAAAYVGVRPATLRRWRFLGTGPEYVRVGRRIVYRVEALDRFLEERAIPPRPLRS